MLPAAPSTVRVMNISLDKAVVYSNYYDSLHKFTLNHIAVGNKSLETKITVKQVFCFNLMYKINAHPLLLLHNPSLKGERQGYRKQTRLSCWDSTIQSLVTHSRLDSHFIQCHPPLLSALDTKGWRIYRRMSFSVLIAPLYIIFENSCGLVELEINLRNTDAQCQKTSQVLWSCSIKFIFHSYFNPNRKKEIRKWSQFYDL